MKPNKMLNISVRKIRKFKRAPILFFRDYLLKRHPLILNHNNINNATEGIIVSALKNSITSFKPGFKIDVVYTWVDANDSAWLQKKKLHSNADIPYALYATEESRFSNHNELYYSLLSIEKNISWVNKIFIVTDNQTPLIPESLKDRVVLVDHSEIIPQQYLPTFNSHVIEAYLHKIKELSEYFIYFNDDFFVAQRNTPEHFFKSNGIASLFVSNKSTSYSSGKERTTATLSACQNCNDLFESNFAVRFDNTLTHTYVPLIKSVFEESTSMFRREIAEFSNNKFRAKNDLNVATFLVPYHQYILGKSAPNLDICFYFNIRSPASGSFYRALINGKKDNNLPHSFCANDFSSNEFNLDGYSERLNEFLSSFFIS